MNIPSNPYSPCRRKLFIRTKHRSSIHSSICIQQIFILIGQNCSTVNTTGCLIAIGRNIISRTPTVNKIQIISTTICSHTFPIQIITGIQEIIIIAGKTFTYVYIQSDGSFTDMTALGGHQYYTIVGTGTIKRRCSGIFQNFDRRNIITINIVHIILLYTINNIQRTTFTVQRSTGTNLNRRSRSRLTGSLRNTYTCNSTGQSRQRIGTYPPLQHFGRNFRNSSRQLIFSYGFSVTRNDNFLQSYSIFFHYNNNTFTPADRNLLFSIAYVRKSQYRFVFCQS